MWEEEELEVPLLWYLVLLLLSLLMLSELVEVVSEEDPPKAIDNPFPQLLWELRKDQPFGSSDYSDLVLHSLTLAFHSRYTSR